MSYHGYVATLQGVTKHPNADRLLLGHCFGNTVCVSIDYVEGQLGVYFPEGGQLSEEFCKFNSLLRLRDENGHSIPGGGYMDPDKRNVTAIRLRGEKSEGIFLPISCLDYCYKGDAASHLNEGDVIDVVNGITVCEKYIPKAQTRQGNVKDGNHTRKKRIPIAPLFAEHADTEQLAYNLAVFQPGDEIEISLKMHGTSQRTGYLPVFSGYKRTLLDRLLRREGTPIYDYGYVTGTRRTVLDTFGDGGFYGNNAFREQHSKTLEGKLWAGETVYFEVVGYANASTPIMGQCSNKKLNDKAFIKQYGKTTTFSYGCEPGESAMYIYRMTMTNKDGEVVEYPPNFMRYRCEQMGVKCVPVLWRGIIPADVENAGEWIKAKAEEFYDGPDPIGKTHIREGVVIRITNKPKFCAYKHKNFFFKVLSGIVVDNVDATNSDLSVDILSEL